MSALRSRVRAAGHEDGFVMVIVMIVIMVGLGLALAGLSAALNSRTAASRDVRVRRAQQAADAGIQAKLYSMSEQDLGSTSYNFNGGLLGLSTLLDCVVPRLNVSLQVTGFTSVAANGAGICPQAVNSNGNSTSFTPSLGDNATYSAEELTGQTNFLNGTSIGAQNGSAMEEQFPKVVSIGKDSTNNPPGSGPVYSREMAVLAPVGPMQVIEGENNVTIQGLTALGINTAVAINGDVIARGNLTTPAAVAGLNLTNPLSGTSLIATLAYGNTLSGGLAIANVQKVSQSNVIPRLPIAITSTSCPACATLPGADYNSTAHTFTMTSGSYTFAPGDYLFCNFSATGTSQISTNPSASSPVRIFIASPTSTYCSGNGYTKSGGVYNGGNFTATNGISNLLTGSFSGITAPLAASGTQIYVQGDESASATPPYDDATTVNLSPAPACASHSLLGICLTATAPPTQAYVIYAPTSSVSVTTGGCLVGILGACTLGGAGVFEGSLIGNDVTVEATVITQDLDIGNYPLYAGLNAFRVVQYVQCDTSVTSLTGTSADTNGC